MPLVIVVSVFFALLAVGGVAVQFRAKEHDAGVATVLIAEAVGVMISIALTCITVHQLNSNNDGQIDLLLGLSLATGLVTFWLTFQTPRQGDDGGRTAVRVASCCYSLVYVAVVIFLANFHVSI